MGRSRPLHNSLGIFCRGRSLKIQREIKERFLRFSKCGPSPEEKFHAIRHLPITHRNLHVNEHVPKNCTLLHEKFPDPVREAFNLNF
jgi:hypothetical protein